MKALLKQRGLKSKIPEREGRFRSDLSISSYLRGTSAARELARLEGLEDKLRVHAGSREHWDRDGRSAGSH